MEQIVQYKGIDYRMSVVFIRKTGTYVLQFNSLSNNIGYSYPCRDFEDARHRFISNYHLRTGHRLDESTIPATEEEFLGVAPGLLYPQRRPKAALKQEAR